MLFPSTLARLPEGHPHARILVRGRLQLTPLKGVGVTGLSIGLSFYPFVPGALKVGPELLVLAAERGHSRDVPALRRGLQLVLDLGEMSLQSGDQLLMVYCPFPFLLFRGALRPLARRAEPLVRCARSRHEHPPAPVRAADGTSLIVSCAWNRNTLTLKLAARAVKGILGALRHTVNRHRMKTYRAAGPATVR